MSLLNSFWIELLTKIKKEKGENSVLYSILKQTKPSKLTDEKITIECDGYPVKKFLDSKTKEIEKIIFKDLGKKTLVEFVLSQTKKTSTKKNTSSSLLSFEPSSDDIFFRSGINKKFSFENFAVSSTNQVAYAASLAVVENLGSAYNPLFLWGGVGVGKTHLAQAIGRKILENNKEKKVYFCPGDNFTNELIESIRDKTTAKFRKKYRRLDLLIIDDIQFIAGKTHVQEEFFHTFNSIISYGGQIILTSDRPPYEIKNLEDRLRSRFSGGLIVDIQPPDFELKTAILLLKAKDKNIAIDIEAAKIIAEKTTDARELEGVLLSLYAQILGKKERIDLEAVDFFFSKKNNQQEKRKINPQEIIKSVCTYFNIRPHQIKSKERSARIALIRQIIMYLIRKELNLTLSQTAKILKRKDHTTVLHAEEKIKSLIMKNPSFKKDIDNIIQTLY